MKIIDFIIAEDVRLEAGNRHSLMGIYGNRITMSLPKMTGPFPLRFGIYVRIDKEGRDIANCVIKLDACLDNKSILPEERPLELPIPRKPSESQFIIMVANFSSIPVPSPGFITFKLQLIENGTTILSGKNPFPIEVGIQSKPLTD